MYLLSNVIEYIYIWCCLFWVSIYLSCWFVFCPLSQGGKIFSPVACSRPPNPAALPRGWWKTSGISSWNLGSLLRGCLGAINGITIYLLTGISNQRMYMSYMYINIDILHILIKGPNKGIVFEMIDIYRIPYYWRGKVWSLDLVGKFRRNPSQNSSSKNYFG